MVWNPGSPEGPRTYFHLSVCLHYPDHLFGRELSSLSIWLFFEGELGFPEAWGPDLHAFFNRATSVHEFEKRMCWLTEKDPRLVFGMTSGKLCKEGKLYDVPHLQTLCEKVLFEKEILGQNSNLGLTSLGLIQEISPLYDKFSDLLEVPLFAVDKIGHSLVRFYPSHSSSKVISPLWRIYLRFQILTWASSHGVEKAVEKIAKLHPQIVFLLQDLKTGYLNYYLEIYRWRDYRKKCHLGAILEDGFYMKIGLSYEEAETYLVDIWGDLLSSESPKSSFNWGSEVQITPLYKNKSVPIYLAFMIRDMLFKFSKPVYEYLNCLSAFSQKIPEMELLIERKAHRLLKIQDGKCQDL